MMSKTYDYKSLVDLYIKISRYDSIHSAFRNYYTDHVNALEQLFGVRLAEKPETSRHHFVLWKLFEDCVRGIRNSGIGSGWLLGGPGSTLNEMVLEEGIEQAKVVREKLADARELEAQSRQKYLELLYELFTLMYGKKEQVFTSEDLLALGFDDTKEPKIEDYEDFI